MLFWEDGSRQKTERKGKQNRKGEKKGGVGERGRGGGADKEKEKSKKPNSSDQK